MASFNKRELQKIDARHLDLSQEPVWTWPALRNKPWGFILMALGLLFHCHEAVSPWKEEVFASPGPSCGPGDGSDSRDFIWSPSKYSTYARLAGNAMTTPVVGACMVGQILCGRCNDVETHVSCGSAASVLTTELNK